MSISTMATTTNPSNIDDGSSQDSEEKCVNITKHCTRILACVQYGTSSASPDNVLEVVCTHFTLEEITEAKLMLTFFSIIMQPFCCIY